MKKYMPEIGSVLLIAFILSVLAYSGCATQTYTATPTADGEAVKYTLRESTLPGMKLEGRRGGLHTQFDEDGSLVELNREEQGLDTTGQMDAIVKIATLIAGGGVSPVVTEMSIPPMLLQLDTEGKVDPEAPALINSIIKQLNSNTAKQQEIIGLLNDLTAQVASMVITVSEPGTITLPGEITVNGETITEDP